MTAGALAFFSNPSEASEWRIAPVNPDFLAYRDGVEKFASPPSPIDWSFLEGSKVDESWFDSKKPSPTTGARSAGETPDAFDLVAEGRVTPVVYQRNWGTCWSFATVKAMESSLLSEFGVPYNLSELHLAYFAYSMEGPGRPGFTRHADPESQNAIFDNGGSTEIAMAILSRGTGPAYEADAPYPEWLKVESDDFTWKNYIPPAPYAPTRFRLKELAVFRDADDIKKALMDTGGMKVSFKADAKYLNDGVNFYNPYEENTNHAVTLVGWDDDYPRENFLTASGDVPSMNGAWKIQNSWGTEAGDRGYFWISYEDRSIFSNGATSFRLAPVEVYDGIYFHDPLGTWGYISAGSPEARMCNVFTAVRNEKIVSVGFFTANVNIDYEIQIYKNISEGKGPESGTLALAVSQSGLAGPQGYYSVTLDEPVRIERGERFAVEVKLIAGSKTIPANIANVTVEAMFYGLSDNVAVAPGESYLYGDGNWIDTYEGLISAEYFDNFSPRNFNLNVKAFTVAAESKESNGGGCDAGALGLFGLAAAGLAGVAIGIKRR
jgi:C1A family cysteine protease